ATRRKGPRFLIGALGRAAPTRSPNGVTGGVSPARRRVAADLKRTVIAVQLDQVEGVARWCRTRSNEATPLSSQATASPSIMQECERRRANVSTISGKRRVGAFPRRRKRRTRRPLVGGL